MAIIQISRITHRTGFKEDLPQLAKAELGWSIDTRELFIGNGLPEQGSPIAGNTQILTEHSDLFALLESYTFKGAAAGYQVTTGTDALNPIVRTLQSKLDDDVNVRDFGAKGDGSTDDTESFKRAISQIYDSIELPYQPLVRRDIKIPAGTYIISSDVLVIPPWASLTGDGKDKTIIKQINVSNDCLIKTGDNLLQTENNIGDNTAYFPTEIKLSDMTLVNDTTKPVAIIDSAYNVSFSNVGFVGNQDSPSVSNVNSAGIVFNSSSAKSTNISFESCDFVNTCYGIVSDMDVSEVKVINCYFSSLLNGISLGENSTSYFPKNWLITGTLFEDIHSEAIATYDGVENITSMGNTFNNVGCGYDGNGFEVTNVIKFSANGCSSVSDMFERTEAYGTIFNNVEYGEYNVSIMNANEGSISGSRISDIGKFSTLLDNIVFPDITGISIPSSVNVAEISYMLRRGDVTRYGTLEIVRSFSTSYISDDYSETANIGVEFSVSHSSPSTTLMYKTTSTGDDIVFKYQIKKFV